MTLTLAVLASMLILLPGLTFFSVPGTSKAHEPARAAPNFLLVQQRHCFSR